jgi:hypothetical protein
VYLAAACCLCGGTLRSCKVSLLTPAAPISTWRPFFSGGNGQSNRRDLIHAIIAFAASAANAGPGSGMALSGGNPSDCTCS